MSLYTSFCPSLNVYFNHMQINRSLRLSNILWGYSLSCDLFRKRIDQKIFFHSNKQQIIILAARWSVKYFLLQILRYSGNVLAKKKRKKKKKAVVKSYICVH